MRVAVLGSNSFTGSHFVDYLMKSTDDTAIGISRSPEYPDVMSAYRYRENPKDASRFQFHQLSVNKDLEQILSIFDKFKPDFVLNFSAQGEVRNSWSWPDQWFETNTMSVVRLSTALVKREYIKRYVGISTPEVYGSTGINMAESHTYQPSTPYASSKLAGDLHLMTLQKRFGFPVCLTRAANLYGIHQQLYRIIPRTAIYAKSGKTLELHGGGKSRRAFIHARDVADATYQICLRGKSGEAYHLTPENELFSIADTVRLVCEIGGYKFDSLVKMIDENFGQDEVFSMSGQKLKNELNWVPKVKFRDGIAETVKWINEEWSTIKGLPHEYVHQV